MRTSPALFGILVAAAALTATSAFSQESFEGDPNSFQSVASPVPGPYIKSGAEISPERGRAIFLENCAVCHGLFGRGDGPRSAGFDESQYIPDLSDGFIIEGRDDEVIEEIREGLHRMELPATTMPQFKYILSQSDIESVLEYLKILPEIAPPLFE